MNFDETIESYIKYFESKNIFTPDFLSLFMNFAQEYRDGRLIHQLHEKFKQDKSKLKNLASKSYSHENGFAKLVIWENENSRFRLRLHIWEEKNEVHSNIHNHRFNFTSFILKGKIKNIMWKLDDNGDNFSYYHYIPRLEKGTYQMLKIGNAKLRISEETIFKEGEVYGLNHNDLHTSENQSEYLITLFIEDRSVLGEFAKVYSNRYVNEQNFIIISPSLEMYDYLRILERISSILQMNNTLQVPSKK